MATDNPPIKTFRHPQPNVASAKADRGEYGDWQTSMKLALAVCRLMKARGVNPQVIIEPTCGKGHFILAALQTFDRIEEVYGIEICEPYLDELKASIRQYCRDNTAARNVKFNLFHQNVFDFDFTSIKKNLNHREVLAIGNPPWVTNSKLGILQSSNIPAKSNFKKAKGIDAMTGKGNFDIAEYICWQMIDCLKGEDATLAFLIKNAVIKNLILEQKQGRHPISSVIQYNIDAKEEFGASVAAALLCAKVGSAAEKKCLVRDFYSSERLYEFGWVDDNFVADMASYRQCRYMDGKSPLTWWSGIKHDCSKVMELSLVNGHLVNGFGQVVDIEDKLVYPLVKSSDIKSERITTTRKYVIVTQRSASANTDWIRQNCPLTYKYLSGHAALLDGRKSSIYKGRPRFCLFGIGDYSFKKYKVVISGLYKKPFFSLVGEIGNKPVMLDDTCYLLGFDDYREACIAQSILNSLPVQTFIHSLLFIDAKRVINKELLMRIDLLKIIRHLDAENLKINETELKRFASRLKASSTPIQFTLFQ